MTRRQQYASQMTDLTETQRVGTMISKTFRTVKTNFYFLDEPVYDTVIRHQIYDKPQ